MAILDRNLFLLLAAIVTMTTISTACFAATSAQIEACDEILNDRSLLYPRGDFEECANLATTYSIRQEQIFDCGRLTINQRELRVCLRDFVMKADFKIREF